jgi:phage terminase large subunit GpA-like protein
MKQTHVYTIDLNKITGNGEFPCPCCGTTMSPDDDTEETYQILEPIVNSHGLEQLIIRCNKCSTQIHLTGFSFLQKTTQTKSNETPTKKEQREALNYITHM